MEGHHWETTAMLDLLEKHFTLLTKQEALDIHLSIMTSHSIQTLLMEETTVKIQIAIEMLYNIKHKKHGMSKVLRTMSLLEMIT